uniref:Bridging integrator 2a n=1 Tax=Echeneis naucrates TaxID=173247 RepID=A0A665W5L9_ECHNA
MTDSTSPRGNSGDFTKKVQRQLSRGKEKVLQKLGKTVETRDDQFEHFQQQFSDQQTDGNRIYKDLRNYINAVRDMREASRRLSQSLFDVYENDWAAEEDLGAIVEGEDLLWNDYEVKLLDQAVRTMESYVCQFPDVRVRQEEIIYLDYFHLQEKIAKRGRKLVDYDSSRHHLEALQTAKKRDDIKINKANEEVNYAKSVYEGINNELKQELPTLYDSRIGCYVTVFSAISSLRDTFYKEMCTLNVDLHNVIKELQAQHPDKAFSVRGLQPYGSLRRRTLLSPKAWKTSFSEFHRSYNPKVGQRFSFRSPDKPRRGTLSRESSTRSVSQQLQTPESPNYESRDLDAESRHSEINSSPAQEELKSGEDSSQVEEEKAVKDKEEPDLKPPAGSDENGDDVNILRSDSSSELNNSCDSESLELKLSALDNSPLHIEEREDSPVTFDTPKANRLENGELSGFSSKDLSIPHKTTCLHKKEDTSEMNEAEI